MTKVAFLGASIVEGAGASSPTRRFTTVACRTFGWEEINLGTSGTTVTGRDDEGQVTDEDSGIGRVPDVHNAHPDLLFIMHGGNDFAQSRPLGNPAQFQQGTFLWDYDTMIRGLLFELQAEQIILMTLPERISERTPNALGFTLPDYNQVIKNVGERYGLRVLDTYADAGLNLDQDYAGDGIHPNDTGHECLAAFIIQALHEKPVSLPAP